MGLLQRVLYFTFTSQFAHPISVGLNKYEGRLINKGRFLIIFLFEGLQKQVTHQKKA